MFLRAWKMTVFEEKKLLTHHLFRKCTSCTTGWKRKYCKLQDNTVQYYSNTAQHDPGYYQHYTVTLLAMVLIAKGVIWLPG